MLRYNWSHGCSSLVLEQVLSVLKPSPWLRPYLSISTNENILRCPILTCSVRSAISWNYRPETRKCAAFQTKRYEKLQEVWPHSIYEIYDRKHKRVWCPGTRPQKSPWAFRQRGTRPKACCASSGRKKLGNQVWSSHCGFPMALWLKQCHKSI